MILEVGRGQKGTMEFDYDNNIMNDDDNISPANVCRESAKVYSSMQEALPIQHDIVFV